jgi:tartrate dehydrogenase/decarboxylase/D-malate dehydrogenase
MTKTYKIAVVEGDGIGHETVPHALAVAKRAADKNGFCIEPAFFPFGAGYYQSHGDFMPKDGLETLKKYDAILFGAVGLPQVDDTLPARHFTFKVRNAFSQYVNYRPVKLYDGVPCPLRNKQPGDIDFVVIRENNEGEFVQSGGQIRPDEEDGMAIDTSVFTRRGIERIARYSFALARRRKGKVTNVTKSNTLINSLAYWDRVITEISREYRDVTYEKMYVDAAAANFVLRPEMFDVVLTTNMIGDILSDLGGAIMGGLGLGSSGNINPEKNYPSMFEPIHGSAPDIAGKNIANPVGTILSASLMLEHLCEKQAADDIRKATQRFLKKGPLSKDLGGNSGTQAIGEAILADL